jgi:hypothetical protein
MEANPRKGDTYYQEFQQDVAEDQALVLGWAPRAVVPYGTFRNVLRTREWTRLDPGVVEVKTYARGVGMLRSQMVQGGSEYSELVSVTERN